MIKKVNDFKVFCVAHGIRQKVLSVKSDVGITALHNAQNLGIASDKTLHKLADCLRNDFNIDISFEQISEMIK